MTRVALALLVSLMVEAAAQAPPVWAAASPSRVAGAAARPSKGKSLSPDALESLRGALQGEEEAAALSAVKQLAGSPAGNASAPLIELLAAGTVPPRAEAALDALAKLADPASIEVLELYAGHRSPGQRRRAVAALGVMADARVVPTLMARLGDTSPDVRAAAADALAARKEKKATGRLFKLVKKNDAGAAAPLGLLATPDLIPQIAELHGGVSDDVLAATMGEYIKRPDVADKLRLEVVRTMGKLSGAAATTALIEYLAVVPAKEERASQREAQKIVDDRSKQK
jgi:HEAT repeat protein